MKCGVAVVAMNSTDWDRVNAKQWDRPPAVPDHVIWDRSLEIGEMIEPLGFDSIWASEHFATPYGLSPNSLQLLAYLAGRTTRVDMGTLVTVLPWWHPVKVTHEIAMLDILLKGRKFTIGAGRGLSPKEFGPLGVPQEEARQRFNEIIDIMRLGFEKERFSYDGEIFKIPEMSIRPQPRHRDIAKHAVAAFMTPQSLEAIARAGLGHIVVTAESFDKIGDDTRLFNAIRKESGFEPDSQPIVYLFGICVEKESEVEAAREYLVMPDAGHHYGFADLGTVKGYEHYGKMAEKAAAQKAQASTAVGLPDTGQLIGTPDQLIKKLQDMQLRTSAREIVVAFNFGMLPHEMAKKSMQLFAKEVLPAVHAIATPLHEHHTVSVAAAE